MITSKEKSDSRKLPMMPIRDVVIFPFMMTPFVVGRESSVRALEEAMAGDIVYITGLAEVSIAQEVFRFHIGQTNKPCGRVNISTINSVE